MQERPRLRTAHWSTIVSTDDRKTLEIRYSPWRVLRYVAVAAGGVLLSWYLIGAECHWASCVLGWIGLLIAGASLADALWRMSCLMRGPDIILSLDGVETYGARIPWSAVSHMTAKRELGMSTIELHFFPGAGDHLQYDSAGRLARWMSKMSQNDGLILSAFALQIGHDDLADLIDAYLAKVHRELSEGVGLSPLDGPASAP